jgi:hypothetical protein
MKRSQSLFLIFALAFSIISCNKEKTMQTEDPGKVKALKEKLATYSPTVIKADLSMLTERERKVVEKLVEVSKLADEIFWNQCSPDGIKVRDSLKKLNDPYSKDLLEYVTINYGAYDLIFDKIRFVGNGPSVKPKVANLYPQDMTQKEFEDYIKAHPEQKEELQSQYTVVKRDGNRLYGEPYYKAYPEVEKIAKLLEEAAGFADDPALKKYLLLRAKAFRTDNYFESDMAWMDMTDSDIEIVVGPIENYIEDLFTYKTAWECGIFVKDIEATKELQVLKAHIDQLEKNLPYSEENTKFIRKSAGGMSSILNIVNVVSFAGDFQKSVKTIATSLPNDPIVHEKKGAKKLMFKNMMEAKFDKIVVPIAEILMAKEDLQYVDKKAFTSFVTLHEISHTLGRGFVFGNDKLSVREAMKDISTVIEEAKADILSMFNHQYLIEIGVYPKDYMKKAMVTYLAGLFRSMRFGAGEAHGGANYIQFNYLRNNGAIDIVNGKFKINEDKFFDKVAELARLIITAQAEGNYAAAKDILDKYGKETPEIKQAIDKLKSIPRDLDTKYEM